MFTRSTIALAILLGIASGAFAATKKQDNSTPPEGVYINNPPPTWHDPSLPMKTGDSDGVRRD
jgi:hypothetical protein